MPRYRPARPVPRAYDRRVPWKYTWTHSIRYVSGDPSTLREVSYNMQTGSYTAREVVFYKLVFSEDEPFFTGFEPTYGDRAPC